MSRQELAEAVNAWLFEHTGRTFSIDAVHIGKLERGEHRWPSTHYRAAFRAVFGVVSDAELGFFVTRRHVSDPAPAEPAPSGPACGTGEVAADPDAGAGTTVRVSVGAQPGKAITVVCPDGAAGRVAVEVGAVRVLIDASGADPGGMPAPVVDVPPVPVSAGAARVYPLTRRRAG